MCQCDGIPFLAAREGKINNDATVGGSVGVSNPGAKLRFGKNVVLADGTVVEADTAQIGNASSVDNVLANTLIQGSGVTIRGTKGTPTLPIVQPFCSIPAITCGTSTVQVAPGASVGPCRREPMASSRC